MRVGMLGAGLIATYHSKMLRASGLAVERAGVFDPDGDRAERFAAASGHHACSSAEEVLAWTHVDDQKRFRKALSDALKGSNDNFVCEYRVARDDGEWIWLHSRGVPGSHVIVKWSGGRTDEVILQAAAELAAYYSANRESGRVEVDHAARRDVRKIKGAGPGMVTYRNEHTVRVAPRSEQDLRKLGLIE